MSLETDVANLVTKTTQLIDYFNGKKAGIDSAVAAAIAAVPANSRSYWVDQVTGLDTNPGTLASPFATIDKAIKNTPSGGICNIYLMSDYVWSGSVNTDLQLVHIRSSVSLTKRKITLPYFLLDGGTRLPGLVFASAGAAMLTEIILSFPSVSGVSPAPSAFHNSFFKTASIGGVPQISVKMSSCEVVSAADGTGAIFVRLSSAICFMVIDCTFPSGFGGRYISGIASGANPALSTDVITNLAAL